jgi:hypothetical protein
MIKFGGCYEGEKGEEVTTTMDMAGRYEEGKGCGSRG